MTRRRGCHTCGRASWDPMIGNPGRVECHCDQLDRMSDGEVDMARDGLCPRWLPALTNPCPVCGEWPEMVQGVHREFAFSLECGCGLHTRWKPSQAIAVRAWNRNARRVGKGVRP